MNTEMILAFLVFLVFGTGMLLLGGIPLKRKFDMNHNGVEVDAEAVKVDSVWDAESDSTRYRYTLRFTDEVDGVHEVEWNRLFHRSFADAHPVGSMFRIRYDRRHPERIDAPGDTAVSIGWWLMILTAALCYFFGILLLVIGGE